MQSSLHLYIFIPWGTLVLGYGHLYQGDTDVSSVVTVFTVIQLGVLDSITKTKCLKYSSFRRTLLQGGWLRPLCFLHPRFSLRHSVPWVGWHLGAVWLRERLFVLRNILSRGDSMSLGFILLLGLSYCIKLSSYRVSPCCWSTICFEQRLSYADVTGFAQSAHRLS